MSRGDCYQPPSHISCKEESSRHWESREFVLAARMHCDISDMSPLKTYRFPILLRRLACRHPTRIPPRHVPVVFPWRIPRRREKQIRGSLLIWNKRGETYARTGLFPRGCLRSLYPPAFSRQRPGFRSILSARRVHGGLEARTELSSSAAFRKHPAGWRILTSVTLSGPN